MSSHPDSLPIVPPLRRPGRRVSRAGRLLLLLFLGVIGIPTAGCDRPCDRLLSRIQTCAHKSGDADLYAPKAVQETLRLRCRRAVPTRVKACLAEPTCPRLMQCATKALRAAPARL